MNINRYKILLVEDEKNQRLLLAGALKKEKYIIAEADNIESAKKKFSDDLFDLVISDQRLRKKNDGLDFLKFCKENNPEIPVILITAYGNIENAVFAMKKGAYHYLSKPIDLSELFQVIKKSIDELNIVRENRLVQEKYIKVFDDFPIIAESDEMKEILSIVSRVASYNVSVLITGESGVGKEVVARLIHFVSPRKENPFIAVNCAAIPETLLEAELFGAEKGSYTGSISLRKGRFELAMNGTIFLDEIGDIPSVIQVKLLRVLAEKKIVRLGGEKTRSIDVRVVAATNKNLQEEIKKNNYREDLFYRLNVVEIHIPPLRERRDDILPLTKRIIKTMKKKYPQKKNIDISWEAEKVLLKNNWKGNVRELENVLQRAIVLNRSGTITKDDIKQINAEENLTLEYIEKKHIEKVLKITNSSMQKTSEILNIHRNTLREKIVKYKLK